MEQPDANHPQYWHGYNAALDEWELRSDVPMVEVIEKVNKKLSHVADVCEAGGHTSRAKMFRAIRDELLAELRGVSGDAISSVQSSHPR